MSADFCMHHPYNPRCILNFRLRSPLGGSSGPEPHRPNPWELTKDISVSSLVDSSLKEFSAPPKSLNNSNKKSVGPNSPILEFRFSRKGTDAEGPTKALLIKLNSLISLQSND